MLYLSFLGSYGPSLAAFGAFGLLHSICAQEPFKNALARRTGLFFVDHFWRLIYCAVSYGALYYGVASLHWARNTEYDFWVFIYPDWLWQAITVLHLGSIALIYAAFLQSDYLEFWGFRQAWRGICTLLGVAASEVRLFGTHRLETQGVYGWVRHPMLSAGLLFLLTSGPSLNNFVYIVMYTAYMLIGGYYEERRLLRIFGEDYRAYRRVVGAFFPRVRQLVA
jgi:protein-S-isoprenylcysteine O-methyltransferase Ste14